jgi:two-component system CheB/CheR fusion protein
LFLVILEDTPDTVADTTPVAHWRRRAPARPSSRIVLAQIAALQDELRAKDEYLQSTHEELESSNEELKSSNEEMQSVNEELQSTNEELETSKEELQSVNEELSTVNSELATQGRRPVTPEQRHEQPAGRHRHCHGVCRSPVAHPAFYPHAPQLINLIASDVGRPVGHIVSNLVGYSSLVADVQVGARHPGAQRGAGANHRRAWFSAHSPLPHAGQRD